MLLKIGSKSDYVKQVQVKLGLTATGLFDTATANAVKVWQTNHALPVTGVVDDATWNSMFG